MKLFQIRFRYFFLLTLVILVHICKGQRSDFQDIDFKSADSIATLYPGYPIENLKDLSDKLTESLATDIEKFRSIYLWVCLNIDNDYTLYIQNKLKREKLNDEPDELEKWNNNFIDRVFEKLIKDHSTVCTGYAYLVKELSFFAGIECEIINGYGRTLHANLGGPGIPNHSWNSVKLNNRWYLCDPTWSSGSINPELKSFISYFSESYFLTAPEEFIYNHYPLDTSWILLENKPPLKTFLERPLIYKQAIEYHILPKKPQTFNYQVTKGDTVVFNYHLPENRTIKKLNLEIRHGDRINIEESQDGREVQYIFKRKGIYVVHTMADGEYVITHRITVISGRKNSE